MRSPPRRDLPSLGIFVATDLNLIVVAIDFRSVNADFRKRTFYGDMAKALPSRVLGDSQILSFKSFSAFP